MGSAQWAGYEPGAAECDQPGPDRAVGTIPFVYALRVGGFGLADAKQAVRPWQLAQSEDWRCKARGLLDAKRPMISDGTESDRRLQPCVEFDRLAGSHHTYMRYVYFALSARPPMMMLLQMMLVLGELLSHGCMYAALEGCNRGDRRVTNPIELRGFVSLIAGPGAWLLDE